MIMFNKLLVGLNMPFQHVVVSIYLHPHQSRSVLSAWLVLALPRDAKISKIETA